MSFKIGGIQKSTFIDFPDKLACIVFTQGCNFHCGYCHNPELFNQKESVIDLPTLFEFLKTRIGKLDGVVITGGEPTIQKGLKEVIERIKELGFQVKLDTNGTNPDLLEELLPDRLLDYVAMDIKAPLEKYSEIVNANIDTKKIKRSINLIIKSGIDYEFRTTVVKSQLTLEDLLSIGRLIRGANKYYIQKFVPSKTLDERFMTETCYSDNELKGLCVMLEKSVKMAEFR